MSDVNPSRLGQKDAACATDALFLKVFPGEVMGAFAETNVMFGKEGEAGLHIVRDISHGKTAQFPASGKATATYHVPGTRLLGDVIKHNERVIAIDSMLIADTFVSDFDEAMNHYQIRGEYADQLGASLARKGDKQLLQVAVLAARSSATVNGGDGGSAVTNSAAKTDGEVLASLMFDASQTFDEKNVPDDESRYVAVKPAQFYLAVQTTKLLNRDWGGQGSYAGAKLPVVAGLKVVKTNNLPTTDILVENGVASGNTYHANFTKTAAVAWHKSAIGTVRLVGLKTEHDYLIELQGDMLVAKYAMGHGILRPESAVEIATP